MIRLYTVHIDCQLSVTIEYIAFILMTNTVISNSSLLKTLLFQVWSWNPTDIRPRWISALFMGLGLHSFFWAGLNYKVLHTFSMESLSNCLDRNLMMENLPMLHRCCQIFSYCENPVDDGVERINGKYISISVIALIKSKHSLRE